MEKFAVIPFQDSGYFNRDFQDRFYSDLVSKEESSHVFTGAFPGVYIIEREKSLIDNREEFIKNINSMIKNDFESLVEGTGYLEYIFKYLTSNLKGPFIANPLLDMINYVSESLSISGLDDFFITCKLDGLIDDLVKLALILRTNSELPVIDLYNKEEDNDLNGDSNVPYLIEIPFYCYNTSISIRKGEISKGYREEDMSKKEKEKLDRVIESLRNKGVEVEYKNYSHIPNSRGHIAVIVKIDRDKLYRRLKFLAKKDEDE